MMHFTFTHSNSSIPLSLFSMAQRMDFQRNSMVEVFKTNVRTIPEASQIMDLLLRIFPEYDVHFDLEDCDKILRIENKTGAVEVFFIMDSLRSKGYEIERLE